MSTNNTPNTSSEFAVGESLIGEGIINYKSTNNMNTNNNSSQTLFRFAAMRNPELSDPKNKNRRFIFRSTQAKSTSAIDSLVNSTTTLQSLFRNPASISGFTVHSEDSLKTLYPNFYDFAVWVGKDGQIDHLISE